MFEEMLEIADDGSNDWMERTGKDGETGDKVVDHEHVSRSKLRVDTRKWMLARMAPKKYGDATNIKLSGDAENPHCLSCSLKSAETRSSPNDPDDLKRCLADPWWRLTSGKLYKIMVKDGDEDEAGLVLPFIPNEHQLELLENFHNRNIILKARQLGFTTMIAIYFWIVHCSAPMFGQA